MRSRSWRTTRAARLAAVRWVAVLAGGLAAAGCEWFSTMSRTDAIQPHESAPLPPPEHAVPLDGLPAFDLTTVEGLVTNPVAPSDASVERGRAWYLSYCAVCHGADGMGRGPIADMFPAIPPIAGAVRFSDAYLFGLVTQGRGLMPAYGRIPQRSRGDIVNYLRSVTGAPRAGASAGAAAAASADTGAAAP